MSRFDSQRKREVRPLRFLILLGALTISTASWGQGRPLVITSPAVVSAEPGQTISITVKVLSGVFPSGVALMSPIGAAGPVPVSHSSAVLSMTLPKSMSLGPYAITAVASDSRGELQASEPITVDVERSDSPTRLMIYSPTTALAVGDTIPLTVFAIFSDNEKMDVMQSTRLKAISKNIHIATVQNGIVTAVGPGQTIVDLQFGLLTEQINVSVAAAH